MISSAIFNILSWCEIIIVEPFISLLSSSNISIKLLKLHKSIPASGSSNIVSIASLSTTVAISILFNSPPDKEPFTSLSTYSFAHNPTFDNISHASALFMRFFAAIFNRSYTVIPLNLTGC